MNLFWKSEAENKILAKNKVLKEKVDELESDLTRLTEEKRQVHDNLASMTSRKKIEEEDIKHMVKLKEERMEVAFEKKELVLQKKFADDIKAAHDTYRDKVEKGLEKQLTDMRGMYEQMLKLLPNVNVRLKGDV